MRILNQFRCFLQNEDGTTITEYAIIGSLIGIIIIVAVTGIGTTLNNNFEDVEAGFQ